MPAPKGNKFAKGNKGGGMIPNYDSADSMQIKIDEYFNINKVPTIPGLAFHLGFAQSKSLYDYEKKEEFWYVIKRAKLRIESFNAEQLHLSKGNITGVIFTLKNMGWVDSHVLTGEDGKDIIPKIIFTNFKDE